MNKLISAALIGGAALAVGVLPGAAMASAATPPAPIQDPTAPTAPVMPGGGTHHTPGQHTGTHHRAPGGHAGHGRGHHRTGGHGTTKHKPGKRKPGGHRSGTGKAGGGQPGAGGAATGGKSGSGKSGAGKAGSGKAGNGKSGTGKAGNGKPGTGTAVPGRPAGPPIGHLPTKHRPIIKPVVHQPGPGAPTSRSTRILGGGNATDAPWAAQVYWDDLGFECSGSVIAPQWVLTAGHCVGDNGMTVRVGSMRLGGGTAVNVDDAKVDPNGDMALLHLASPVDTSFARLADADPQVGSTNQIYGWGKTSQDSGPAKRLRMASVKVTSVSCTDGKHGKAICSEAVDGAAFNGDSGGPEMADGVEVGVCSTGDDQAQTQQYASVAANRTWLRQVANV